MGRKSSVDRLPAEVRELIGELRNQGRSIDEILAHLHQLDMEVSRSALGRHTKEIDAFVERAAENRAIAEALAARIDGKPIGQVARLNVEMLHASITKLTMGGDIKDSREAMFLATALQKLASAAKVDLDRELTVERESLKKAADKIGGEAKQLGLTKETADAICNRILGVRTDAA